jgi:hypothetical protein
MNQPKQQQAKHGDATGEPDHGARYQERVADEMGFVRHSVPVLLSVDGAFVGIERWDETWWHSRALAIL